MDCHHTSNLHHLLDPNVRNRKYRSMEDILQSTMLIPGVSIDISSESCIFSLRRFHEQSNCNIPIVRGLDTSSKHDFISILLTNVNDDPFKWKVLWICKFDERGMSSSRLYLYIHPMQFDDGPGAVPEFDGPDIIALQSLLVKEHCVFDNIHDLYRKNGTERMFECTFCIIICTFCKYSWQM